ncbi:hypothetical protein SDC9_171374 [bioreactor metagenome]|uniref:Uncharacterized protein n=1 Tax=bioreactor metagenome TaxID=1076179 RepID=A0A645GAQ2_9ZZZZ
MEASAKPPGRWPGEPCVSAREILVFKNGDAVEQCVGDKNLVSVAGNALGGEEAVVIAAEVAEAFQEGACGGEYLDPVVGAVGHVDLIVGVAGDANGQEQVSVPRAPVIQRAAHGNASVGAPLGQEGSAAAEFLDAAVVAVYHIHVVVGIAGDVGGHVKLPVSGA